VPLKIITSHLNKLSGPTFDDKQLLPSKELIEEEMEIQINEIRSLGEELFAEGAYLEAQKQFKAGRDLLMNLGREEEAKLFSELLSGIEGLIEEREKRLETLEQVKLEGNVAQVFELYHEIINISKKLRDLDAISMFQSELIQYFQINQFRLKDIENHRSNLEDEADSLLNKKYFELAAQIYGKCEEISQFLMKVGNEEEIANVEKFRNKKNKCLEKFS
ncbi:MAG: hypothetical protein ACFE91_15900, partial [Promethearchaeota archaeon]